MNFPMFGQDFVTGLPNSDGNTTILNRGPFF